MRQKTHVANPCKSAIGVNSLFVMDSVIDPVLEFAIILVRPFAGYIIVINVDVTFLLVPSANWFHFAKRSIICCFS